ncbi:hypothetical protein D3C74_475990 [compost metagenome]
MDAALDLTQQRFDQNHGCCIATNGGSGVRFALHVLHELCTAPQELSKMTEVTFTE